MRGNDYHKFGHAYLCFACTLKNGADYAYIVNTERTTNRTRANNKRITFICTLPVLTLEYKKLPSVCTLRHRVTDNIIFPSVASPVPSSETLICRLDMDFPSR